MTVSSSTRRAGPFNGNGVTIAFPFAFKVFASGDIALYLTDASGAQTLLTSNYTVTLNPDQDSSPGGAINYPTVGSPLATGAKLDVVGAVAYTQGTDITNAGRFLPQVIEDALDKLTIIAQQLLEKFARTISFPVGDTASATLPGAEARKGALLAFDETTGAPVAGPNIASVGTVTANVASIASVSANIGSVNTVAGAVSNVNAVAANAGNVNTVAGAIANVNAVGANIGNVNTVAGNNANVSAVAGNAGNVSTVAGAIANVNTVGTNIAGVNTTATSIAQVLDAPNQASLAAAAKTAAEAARDTALATAKMYANTAAAVADSGLAVNAYFTTPSTVVGEAAILYQKVAGPAATDTGIRIPSAALVPQVLPVESGYSWALLDSTGAAAIRVRPDGTVELPKYENLQYIAKYLNPESGNVWAVVDQNDKIALSVTTKGEVFARLQDGSVPLAKLAADVTTRLPPAVTMPFLQAPAANLWAFGDSLTEFQTWVELIGTYLNTPRSITRIGQGGQTSTQVAARAGASFALLTVTGNQIPASGAVAVTAISNSLMSCYLQSGTTSITGYLAGVYGTLTCTHSASGDTFDTYSFARAASGSAVVCPPKTPFIPETASDLPYRTQVIFLGRNNIGGDATAAALPGDVDAFIALQKTVEKRFLIVTPPLGGTLTPGQSTTDGIGSAIFTRLVAFEDWATAKYGDRVIKLRELSFQFGNGSADDNDDIAKGVVPRSLRQDTTHYTYPTGYGKVAQLFAAELNRRGW